MFDLKLNEYQRYIIVSHLKLGVAEARHNFKFSSLKVKIHEYIRAILENMSV